MSGSANINILMRLRDKVANSLRRDFEELKLLQSSVNSTMSYAETAQKRLESLVIAELKKARPNFGIISPNSRENHGIDKRFRWVVNVLSDVDNFAHALPFSTVSVVLEEENSNKSINAVTAMVYVVGTQETFFAEKGNGAWVNDTDSVRNYDSRIRVSSRKDTKHLLVVSNKKLLEVKEVNFNSNILALTYLAAGRIDAAILNDVDYTELAGVSLLIREAGGSVELTKEHDAFNIKATNTYCDKVLKDL